MCRLALIALGCLLFTSQAQAKLKVFILAGQSNMQGAGAIKINPKSKNGGKGTLEYLVKEERLAKRLAHVVDASGDWVCLLYTSPSPRDPKTSRMPSSA